MNDKRQMLIELAGAGEPALGSSPGMERIALAAGQAPGERSFATGWAVPDHELLHRIGQGSYGEVWLARNVFGEFRAVKIVHRSRFADPRPFEREFEGIRRFEPISRSHPSQLAILHVGKNEPAGYFYYVMELADPVGMAKAEVRNPNESRSPKFEAFPAKEGFRVSDPGSRPGAGPRPSGVYIPHTLRHDLEQNGKLPMADCLQVGLSLTTALAHLHARALVHRDIKPSNVIFVNGVAKLGDIGLVTEVGDTQSIVGTEGYIPPEGPGTPQADIFALGKVLYEAATGLDRRRFAELPEDLRTWPERESVVEFNEVLLKACSANPAHRYRCTEEMLADLNCLSTGGSVRQQRAREGRVARGKRLLAAVVALSILAGVISLFWHQARAPRRLSKSPRAEALYNRALYEMASDTVERRMLAYSDLNEAIRLDPGFVDAYSKKVEVYFDSYVGSRMPPHYDNVANFREATEALRRVAPHSAQYHTAQGFVDFCDWHFDKAIEEEALAKKLDPDFLRAHSNYAWFILFVRGDVETALREFKEAERLDPNDVYLKIHRSCAYWMQGRFDAAIQEQRDVMRMEWQTTQLHLNLGDLLAADKAYDKALEEYEKFDMLNGADPERTKSWYLRLHKELKEKGPRGLWQAQLEKEHENPDPDLYRIARLYSLLGSKEQAFRLLDRAFNKHHGCMCFLFMDDALDSLHRDPRFGQLVQKMGFHPIPGAIR